MRRAAAWPIATLQDVSRYTLLRHVTVPEAWRRWSETHGIKGLNLLAGPQFDQFQTMIRAVMAGMGLALVPRCLVQDEITAGMVREPLPQGGYQSGMGYWFCYPESRRQLPTLDCFRRWLLASAVQPTVAPAPHLSASARSVSTAALR